MDEATFWKLIERVRNEYPDDLDDQCTHLGQVLERLPPDQCLSAGRWFDVAIQRAYHWPLWAAAFVIGGGCSDDSFMDFRAALIMKGRTLFEAALRDPDSLAEHTFPEEAWFFEGYQYVVHEAMDAAMDTGATVDIPEHPQDPSGDEWREDELAILLPRLFAKHTT